VEQAGSSAGLLGGYHVEVAKCSGGLVVENSQSVEVDRLAEPVHGVGSESVQYELEDLCKVEAEEGGTGDGCLVLDQSPEDITVLRMTSFQPVGRGLVEEPDMADRVPVDLEVRQRESKVPSLYVSTGDCRRRGRRGSLRSSGLFPAAAPARSYADRTWHAACRSTAPTGCRSPCRPW